MSEWLGTGLQNRLHQFESGWNLLIESDSDESLFFVYIFLKIRKRRAQARGCGGIYARKNGEPAQTSGRQELCEAIVAMYS